MGRNFLGCPWRAHDEVNVSHEFVIEHQRVPASRGAGRSRVSRGLPLARCPSLPPAAPGAPAHPRALAWPGAGAQGGRLALPPARGGSGGPGPYLSRSVGWKDCQLALSKLLLLRFWSWGGGGGWALCWSCRAFFLLLAAVAAAALLFAMLVLVLAG